LKLSISVWCIGVIAAVSTAQPHNHGPLPKTILSTTLAPEQIVTQASAWRELGIDGIAIDAKHLGEDNPSIAETLSEFAAAGFARVFVRIQLPNQSAYLTPGSDRDMTLAMVRSLGEGIAHLGVAGIVVDANARSNSFDPFFTGYDRAATGLKSLETGATRFGRRLIQVIAETLPEAEILLVTDDVEETGQLWLPFIGGCVAGLDMADGMTVGVVTREARFTMIPSHVMEEMKSARRLIESAIAPAHRYAWRQRGGVNMALQPLARRGGHLTANAGTESFRRQFAAASLASSRYIIIEDPESLWNDAAGADVSFVTPFESADRAGSWAYGGADVFMVRTDDGGGAFFYDGFGQTIALETAQPITITTIATAETITHEPVDGVVALEPVGETVFVDGLPVKDSLIPAQLWLAVDGWPSGPGRAPMRYGLSNQSRFRIQGNLNVLAEPPVSVSPNSAAIDLAPGESTEAAATWLNGHTAGERIQIPLMLATPTGDVFKKVFDLHTPPPMAFSYEHAGGVRARACVFDVDGDGTLDIVTASEAGQVICVSVDGDPLWARELDAPVTTGPTAGLRWDGSPYTAIADESGNVHSFDGAGELLWRQSLPSVAGPGGIVPAYLHPFPGTELVVALNDGTIASLHANGEPFWQISLGSPARYVTPFDANRDSADELFVTGGIGDDGIICLSGGGEVLWQAFVVGGSSGPAACAWLPEGFAAAYVGTQDGRVEAFHAATGAPMTPLNLNSPGRVLAVRAADVLTTPGPELFVQTESAIECFTYAGAPLWQVHARCDVPVTLVQTDWTAFIAAPLRDGPVVLWDVMGRRQWCDERSAGSVNGTVEYAIRSGGDQLLAVYGSTDRRVRVVEAGRR